MSKASTSYPGLPGRTLNFFLCSSSEISQFLFELDFVPKLVRLTFFAFDNRFLLHVRVSILSRLGIIY